MAANDHDFPVVTPRVTDYQVSAVNSTVCSTIVGCDAAPNTPGSSPICREHGILRFLIFAFLSMQKCFIGSFLDPFCQGYLAEILLLQVLINSRSNQLIFCSRQKSATLFSDVQPHAALLFPIYSYPECKKLEG